MSTAKDFAAGQLSLLPALESTNYPPTWAICRLGELLDIQGGTQPPKSNFKYEDQEGYIRLLQIRDFGEREVPTYIPDSAKLKKCSAEDIMIARYGASLGRIITGMAGAYNVALVKTIFDRNHLNPRFIFYLLQTRYFQTPIHMISRSAQNGFNKPEIMPIEVPLAPHTEQQRIVAKLDELFSDLDAATAALERVQANLKRYRASVLKSAVEGKLTAEWRARNPPKETGAELLERILKERRVKWEENQLAKFKAQGKEPSKDWQKKYPEPVKPDTTNLPELPEGWVWASLDQLSLGIRNGIAEKPNHQPPGTPILRISSVRPMSVNLQEVRYIKDSSAYDSDDYLVEGDLLFTRYNGSVDYLGVCGRVQGLTEPYLYPDKLMKVLLVSDSWSRLIEFASNIGYSRRHVVSKARTTAGQTGISGGDLKSMPIPLCSHDEFQYMVTLLDDFYPNCEKMNQELQVQRLRIQSTRQAILKQAFEGKLVSQDVNDEPASELLKRIREAREQQEAAAAGAKQERQANGAGRAKKSRTTSPTQGKTAKRK